MFLPRFLRAALLDLAVQVLHLRHEGGVLRGILLVGRGRSIDVRGENGQLFCVVGVGVSCDRAAVMEERVRAPRDWANELAEGEGGADGGRLHSRWGIMSCLRLGMIGACC